ncbi:hypothetical protein CJ030_MR2G004058 [Morella rubra]|uniref:Uncharacterized protein n=1 Tax=Morella rubra TaxID=262757 RepID=A0A6A1WCE7_9ROSI|nr:hypothetical protein CJ030_MR2G004058 [Morella rubra]
MTPPVNRLWAADLSPQQAKEQTISLNLKNQMQRAPIWSIKHIIHNPEQPAMPFFRVCRSFQEPHSRKYTSGEGGKRKQEPTKSNKRKKRTTSRDWSTSFFPNIKFVQRHIH